MGRGGGGGLLNPYLIYTSDVYSSEHWYKHGGHNATDDNVANNREIELRSVSIYLRWQAEKRYRRKKRHQD